MDPDRSTISTMSSGSGSALIVELAHDALPPDPFPEPPSNDTPPPAPLPLPDPAPGPAPCPLESNPLSLPRAEHATAMQGASITAHRSQAIVHLRSNVTCNKPNNLGCNNGRRPSRSCSTSPRGSPNRF